MYVLVILLIILDLQNRFCAVVNLNILELVLYWICKYPETLCYLVDLINTTFIHLSSSKLLDIIVIY